MLYGTAEFRKNFYIKLRQMTGIIFRAPGRIDATRVHARASAKRATGSGVRFGSKADMCSAKGHVRFTPENGHVWRTSMSALCQKRTFGRHLLHFFNLAGLPRLVEAVPCPIIGNHALRRVQSTFCLIKRASGAIWLRIF